MTPTSPQKLGRYEVLEEIGKGAMGVVYLARDPLIGRLVALKTFRVGFSAKDQELAQFRSRFVREAQSAGILSHPNIVTIHDVVDEGADGVCFIAMEYVKGTNLKQLLQKPDAFTTEFLVEVVSQVAEALDYAHSRGVVHRDIKPANILITPESKVKITDFGIARLDTSNLTMEGQLLGTPNYMAPEQIQGKDVDHRADIFSLGVVFYEMLTRRKPFAGENLTAVTHKIVFEPFTPAEEIVKDLPAGLTPVLDRCLEKDPNRRFPRAAEIAKELRRRLESGQDLDDTSATQEVEPIEAPTRRISRAEILAAAVPLAPATADTPAPAPSMPPAPAVPALPEPVAEAPEKAVGEATVDARDSLPPVPATRPEPARRKWLLPAVVAIAVVGFLGIFGLWMVGGSSQKAPVAPALSPEQQNRLTAATALAEGRTLLAQGNLQGALQAVARAELADPSSQDAAELRRQIDVRSRELAAAAEIDRRVAEGMITAREAYSRRRYEDALTAVRGVLDLRPEEPEAIKLAADAEDAIEDQRQRQRAARAATPTPVVAAAPTRAVPAQTAPQPTMAAPIPADTTLVVDFYSDSSEGILTIYAGERQIVREPFKFVRKTGFLRSEKISGELEARRTLDPGPTTLRVYVSMPGRATKAVVVDGELRPGAEQVLEIRVDEEGATTATLH
ncbi:MAG: serine/threonine protein kinase [Acidobacteria bacterium]|nr:serine/threonine protein kinase [Acidobacteriota bacterium]